MNSLNSGEAISNHDINKRELYRTLDSFDVPLWHPSWYRTNVTTQESIGKQTNDSQELNYSFGFQFPLPSSTCISLCYLQPVFHLFVWILWTDHTVAQITLYKSWVLMKAMTEAKCLRGNTNLKLNQQSGLHMAAVSPIRRFGAVANQIIW